MYESFIHYLWQFQYFSKNDLRTTQGEEIVVFHPGFKNTHAGPDFYQSRIKIGELEWVGSVEIHIHSSFWQTHNHNVDEAYENVVLHVVWSDDKPVKRMDGSLIPTLELKNRVDDALQLTYKKLVNSPEEIPCASSFQQVSEITKLSMLDRVLSERLESKAFVVNQILVRNNNDWEETAYQVLAKNFGFHVNADPFLQLAQNLPYKTIMKHSDKPIQIEALLFGQAGFLEKSEGDEYINILKREYDLLGKKYRLNEGRLNKAQWKFLRLRPANFPTIRLAQFANLLFCRKNLFSNMVEASLDMKWKTFFSLQQSDYWLRHYQFNKQTEEKIPVLGQMSKDNLVINSLVPLLVAYGKSKDDQMLVDRAITILQHVKSEANTITRTWASLQLKSKSAFDSQAMIELHNNY
ncbi:MAG TPA: DUF2851 family protein, partial [Chryseolinea sp.]|nr:DUF2851 family protein [Chryseolinea sp.]